MRFIYTIFLLLLVTNAFAQKVIPYDEHIEEKLWEEARDLPEVSPMDENDEIWKHVLIRDLTSNQFVDPDSLLMDYGILEFYDPGVNPRRCHILIKYHDSLVIIKDDRSEEALARQFKSLIEFFEEHEDIPQSYFLTFSKHLINVYEENRIYLE